MRAARKRAIERYLRTGHADLLPVGWDGDVVEAGRRASEDLKKALVDGLLAAECRRALRAQLCGGA